MNAKTSLSVVRKFENAAENKITDLGFSHDARWLLSSSLDRSVRVWDIVTGSLIDWIKFKQAPLSIDMSPSGEFLATTHLNQKGVFLWANKTHFSDTVIQKVAAKATEIDLPELSAALAQAKAL